MQSNCNLPGAREVWGMGSLPRTSALNFLKPPEPPPPKAESRFFASLFSFRVGSRSARNDCDFLAGALTAKSICNYRHGEQAQENFWSNSQRTPLSPIKTYRQQRANTFRKYFLRSSRQSSEHDNCNFYCQTRGNQRRGKKGKRPGEGIQVLRVIL